MDNDHYRDVWIYQRDYNIRAIFKNEPARRRSIRGFSLKEGGGSTERLTPKGVG